MHLELYSKFNSKKKESVLFVVVMGRDFRNIAGGLHPPRPPPVLSWCSRSSCRTCNLEQPGGPNTKLESAPGGLCTPFCWAGIEDPADAHAILDTLGDQAQNIKLLPGGGPVTSPDHPHVELVFEIQLLHVQDWTLDICNLRGDGSCAAPHLYKNN